MATLNAEYLIPDDVRSQTRMKGFAEVIGQLFDGAGDTLDKLKIYDFDNLTEDQLDAYANHFWIGAYSDCSNLAQKRALIKLSGKLSGLKGTPYAIKTALETLGFENVIIHENADVSAVKYDGMYKYNGWIQYNTTVIYDKNLFEVSADNMTGNEAKARRIIFAYKGAKDFLSNVFNN